MRKGVLDGSIGGTCVGSVRCSFVMVLRERGTSQGSISRWRSFPALRSHGINQGDAGSVGLHSRGRRETYLATRG